MKNTFTKKAIIGLAILLACAYGKAQTGLQNVIVEKYYMSDANDSINSQGMLPKGSVTYRVFLDMKQGYKLQTVFGSSVHTLFIKTTTSFFNNEDRGNTNPTYTKAQAKSNTVMLDSWLTVGAACAGNFGILKSEDNGVETVVNTDGILKNANPAAGIPLTQQDGLIAGTPGTFISLGIDNELAVFDAISQQGNSFVTTNGAWSCLSGAVGPDTTNKVLIAQLTTEGILTFELNVQLGTPSGGTEQFVAKNAAGTETVFPGLTYNSLYAGINDPSISSNGGKDIIAVSPNPAHSLVELKVKSENVHQNQFYIIYDMLGNQVAKKSINNGQKDFTETIDLSAFPAGLYVVQVSLDGKVSTTKLIKN